MAQITWENIAKSIDDKQTIEDYVNGLFTAHNTDVSAHGQLGEGISNHRVGNILDHLNGSVAAEKLSDKDFFNLCSFESLDNFTSYGTIDLDGWPGVKITVEDGGDVASGIYSTVLHPQGFLTYDSIIVFQTVFWLDEELPCAFQAHLGNWVDKTNFDGFGFYYEDGDLKGFWGNPASKKFTSAITVDLTKRHVYRAQFDPNTDRINFYLDGTLVKYLYFENPPGNIEPDVRFRAELLEHDDTFIAFVRNLLISKSP